MVDVHRIDDEFRLFFVEDDVVFKGIELGVPHHLVVVNYELDGLL